ncbi:hypothetical protein GCM10010277_05400 [Streptomyces longisporoflavus]|nr:hypothetical protein GCM10010277_05400 [Streptomyces longisporoflavus]
METWFDVPGGVPAVGVDHVPREVVEVVLGVAVQRRIAEGRGACRSSWAGLGWAAWRGVGAPVATSVPTHRTVSPLADGRTLSARRLLVATGLRDVLPDVRGLAGHWGQGVVHCPYCHGWEVRDEPIGILAVGPASVHHALLFRQLTDDLVYFTRGTDLDEDTRARFAARGIRVVDTPVSEVVSAEGGGIGGVRLSGGDLVPRRVLAVATTMRARTEGLDELHLPMRDLPGGTGRHFATGAAGATDVPGVWVAGNAADLSAQVGASAAAGALAGARINADLAVADTDAALDAAERGVTRV